MTRTPENDMKIAEPRLAASILLVRDAPSGLEVLMQERPKTMSFAAGAFVFPGGKVDKKDYGCLPDNDDQASRVAAIRELYEEAGILLGLNIHCKKSGDFDCLKQDIDLGAVTSNLVPFARWVTPTVIPKRFDTTFYLTSDKAGQDVIGHDEETMQSLWVRPSAILHEWEQGAVPLMFPTRLNLLKLSKWNSVKEAMQESAKMKIYTVQPELTKIDGVRTVKIPEEAGYGVTHASQMEMSIEGPKN